MKYTDSELLTYDYILSWQARNEEIASLLADENVEYSGMVDEYRWEISRNDSLIYDAKVELAKMLNSRGISYREFKADIGE